jgi:hypothetical protein
MSASSSLPDNAFQGFSYAPPVERFHVKTANELERITKERINNVEWKNSEYVKIVKIIYNFKLKNINKITYTF